MVGFSFLLYAGGGGGGGGGVLPWLPFTSFVISGLHDVMVVGVPDQDTGQEICACFVPSDPSMTEERVRSYVERDVMAKMEDPLSPPLLPAFFLLPHNLHIQTAEERRQTTGSAESEPELPPPPPPFFFFF